MPRPPLPSELERFLGAPRVAVLATVSGDGVPTTVAVWYEYRDGRLVLPTRGDARRLNDLRAGSPLALTVLAPDWYSHVSLTAEVVEVREDEGLVDLDRIAMSYDGEPFTHDTRDIPYYSVIAEISRWHTYGEPTEPAEPAVPA